MEIISISGCKKRKIELPIENAFAVYNDLKFPKTCPGALYDVRWRANLTEREMYGASSCLESSILSAARKGWIKSEAPNCKRETCKSKRIHQVISTTGIKNTGRGKPDAAKENNRFFMVQYSVTHHM